MKLIKKMVIDDQEYKIVNENIVLEMNTPGRGIILVQSTTKLEGIGRFYIGYDDEYSLYMTCYIEQSRQIDKKQQRLTVRELSAALARRMPMSRQHVTAEDILQELSEKSGVNFIIEEADWNNTVIPQILNFGSGIALLDSLGKELRIDKFIWQQLPSGSVYFGGHDGSPWGKADIGAPVELFTEISAGGASIGIVPKFRPGVKLTIGNSDQVYISKTELSGSGMRLGFKGVIG